ncbi:Fur-regulated basic protein FbpA [Peribacillus sp. SI8-4]|uniref:Fur-regulated basic protein FbpA n=1 Tax=Peribacillus sp. SI8-4 TaxID=3048009 RepID=UPI0025566208|nr:Fur-regulated basic protein FbpA [Peribacillus sp. SI8-4]
MGMRLRKAIETKRNFLINQLINEGIYKKNDAHLFEWTLTDLEQEYRKLSKAKQDVADPEDLPPCLIEQHWAIH